MNQVAREELKYVKEIREVKDIKEVAQMRNDQPKCEQVPWRRRPGERCLGTAGGR